MPEAFSAGQTHRRIPHPGKKRGFCRGEEGHSDGVLVRLAARRLAQRGDGGARRETLGPGSWKFELELAQDAADHRVFEARGDAFGFVYRAAGEQGNEFRGGERRAAVVALVLIAAQGAQEA